jgi:hypothetical protein
MHTSSLGGPPAKVRYNVKVLGIFMKHIKKKRPILVEQGWFFHWDNAPLHIVTIVQD